MANNNSIENGKDPVLPFLDFEQPIAELDAKIEELRYVGDDTELNINEEIRRLQKRSTELIQSIFSSLTAWQIAQVARHPQRPYTLQIISIVFLLTLMNFMVIEILLMIRRLSVV